MVNVDYRYHNYCRHCSKKVEKKIIHCPDCGLMVRRMPKRPTSKRMKPVYEEVRKRI